jgi:hypothetical protein
VTKNLEDTLNRRNFCGTLLAVGLQSALARPIRARSIVLDRSPEEILGQIFKEFPDIGFPAFPMGFQDNLDQIPSLEVLEKQRDWILDAAHSMEEIQSESLPANVSERWSATVNDLDFLNSWNWLSINHRKHPEEVSPSRGFGSRTAEETKALQELASKLDCVYIGHDRWKGLVCLSEGQRWYDLHVRYWTTARKAEHWDPVQSGLRELKRIAGVLDQHQETLAKAQHRISDESEVSQRLQELDRKVRAQKLLLGDVPPVKLARMPADSPVQAPGYYRDGTFYYNMRDGFPERNLTWLYLHEAIPGHHYQSVQKLSSLPRLLSYPGLMEGWGVYAEHLGDEMGFFQDPIQRIGWLLWNQVRTARVVLDYRIHREGWTRGQAETWWIENLPLQKSLAYSELDRVMRWPGQSLSYKVGEQELLRIRAATKVRLGTGFDLNEFHAKVLAREFSSWDELEKRML